MASIHANQVGDLGIRDIDGEAMPVYFGEKLEESKKMRTFRMGKMNLGILGLMKP